MSECRIYHYSGRVQGVGFRYTVQSIAKGYGVAGYVRNLPDGGVEMRLEGAGAQMDAMAEEVAQKMEGFIRAVTMQEQPGGGTIQGFSIRR